MRRTTAKRYADKATARKSVWDALTQKRVARFPFPVHGRIPNFDGAKQAAERLLAHPIFRGVRVTKVNPDSPQRWVRELALERGITVITPTPRLKGAVAPGAACCAASGVPKSSAAVSQPKPAPSPRRKRRRSS